MKWHSYRIEGNIKKAPSIVSQHDANESIRKVQDELDQAGPWPEHIKAWLHTDHPSVLQRIRVAKLDLYQFHIKALSSLARLRLLNVLPCTPRSLNPRRLDIILDLELELDRVCLSQEPAALETALKEYKQAWLEGLMIWRNRVQQPPLMAGY
jgi:hypothetical protein